MTTTCGPQERSCRLAALRRFAVAITVLNLLGHFYLGFEQSWGQPLVSLATTYAMEILLELAAARAAGRPPCFAGGARALLDFLLPAHITGLAVAMLLYANDRLWPIAFAAAVAIGSKVLVRVPVRGRARHCLNPSNTGIAVTLLVFPWVGIAPPYMFTENLSGVGDWFLPTFVVLSGTFLNTQFTGKVPLILGWVGGFIVQAAVRSVAFETPLTAALLPMTGMAFLLFTFYMVTDPGTTPGAPWDQFAFGGSVAAVYAVLMLAHVVFGLFFSLLVVCAIRGIGLTAIDGFRAWSASRPGLRAPSRAAVAVSAALEGVNR